MAPVTNDETAVRRRIPTQGRSRARVERILDAASQIVLADGIEALTTRTVADVAAMPVASIYQYFSDKDAVLLAICERDMAEMDEQVAADLGRLTRLSVRSVVETTMRAYVTVYHRRPAFMQIWLRGRTNNAVNDYGRRHNQRTAADLLAFARERDLVTPDTPAAVAELGVEIGDRVFQLAFEKEVRGEPFLIEEGIEMVVAYLERHATPAGLEGVPA
ncbi:TetR/AcrR family transcriptional regulator [Nocardioides sp.]|uniref:TetR/AcrR family transcriptional regulator n=1 Tax=Nocardioides sp. TaxID=35761 RepID=UPI002735E5B3|nr:TetR/AcrR family transcriptional regulator [Nocardioides sp.]MDP3894940.1 TetR/AcrR family transcriptional regulator [Nocardioides sp.]